MQVVSVVRNALQDLGVLVFGHSVNSHGSAQIDLPAGDHRRDESILAH